MRYGKLPDGMHEIREDDEGAMILGFESDLEEMRKAKRKYVPVDEIKPPVLEGEKWQKKFEDQLENANDPAQGLPAFSEHLGLKPEIAERLRPGLAHESDLRELGVGGKWTKSKAPKWMWATPEYGADGKICGWCFRAADGRKGAAKKSKSGATRGICIPKGLKKMKGHLHIVEGASDVGAMLQMGYAAVGRPSNTSGGAILKDLIPKRKWKLVIVVGENDQKSDGKFPGLDGMIKIKDYLSIAWEIDVPGVMPPPGTEDCRTWLNAAPDLPITFVPFTEDDPKEDPVAAAKSANERAFTNVIFEQHLETGKIRAVGIGINTLVKNLGVRLLGFPRVLGGKLFDHDLGTDEVNFLHSTADLFSWISRKTGQNVEWEKGMGIVTKEEFQSALLAEGKRYNSASLVPFFPEEPSIFITTRSMPKPDPEMGCFNELISKFSPASPQDDILIRSLFSTTLCYLPGLKPLYVIDSNTGQSTGKSTLARFPSHQFGEMFPPFEFNIAELKDSVEIKAQLLGIGGEGRFLVIFDNCQGKIKSAELSSLITNPVTTGRAKFGKGPTSRPNNKTIILTGNNVSLERDLAVRCVPLMLTAPSGYAGAKWERNTTNFIKENKIQIVADQLGAMKRAADKSWLDTVPPPIPRFPEWSEIVLGAHCNTPEEYADIGKLLLERTGEMDGESVEAHDSSENIAELLRKFNFDPDNTWAWFSRSALGKVCSENGAKIPFTKLKEWSGVILKELSAAVTKYPTTAGGAKRLTGLFWVPAEFRNAGAKPTHSDIVVIIHFKDGEFQLMTSGGKLLQRMAG